MLEYCIFWSVWDSICGSMDGENDERALLDH